MAYVIHFSLTMFIIYCDTLTYYNVYRYLWYDDALIVYDIVFPPMTHSKLSMLISSYDTLIDAKADRPNRVRVMNMKNLKKKQVARNSIMVE